MWTTADGHILRLPHYGLAKIMSRLRESGLHELIANPGNGRLERKVANAIGLLAHEARRANQVSHEKSGKNYMVFAAQAHGGNYEILAQPLTQRQHAVLFIRFERDPVQANGKAGKPEKTEAAPTKILAQKSDEVLLREARAVFFRANPHLRGKVEVYHRLPLVWRRLFPKLDPNRLSNLQAAPNSEQRRHVKRLWKAFGRRYKNLQRKPTPKEVMQYVREVDRALGSAPSPP
jgi:hypothetical protein